MPKKVIYGREMTEEKTINRRLRGQAVKTSPFHGGNTGSIPVGVISINFLLTDMVFMFII